MPTFNEFLRLIESHAASSPKELAGAILSDAALAEWERKTLLVQLGLSAGPATSLAPGARSRPRRPGAPRR